VRQFSDEQLRALIVRGAVIGAVLDAWMLIPDWKRGVSTPASTGVSLEQSVNHIDHICQLAGNANHCGIGSDLDASPICSGTRTCFSGAVIPRKTLPKYYTAIGSLFSEGPGGRICSTAGPLLITELRQALTVQAEGSAERVRRIRRLCGKPH
jgi:hypothetical protein